MSRTFVVEDEILAAPVNFARIFLSESWWSRFSVSAQHRPGRVGFLQRNILNEAQGSQARDFGPF